jgi:hypothetical protein
MLQFRQASLHGTSIAAKKQGRGFIIYNNKPNTALNILFRYADASKGDKNSVLLKCSVCLSSYYIDRTPRYEISSGAYVATKQDCYMCRSENPVLFTPVDTSMPFKKYKSIAAAHYKTKQVQRANEIERASRADFEAMALSGI